MSRILNALRSKVSGKKIRLSRDGFDLDLTYITPRIIAMGYPASNAEAAYRNSINDVAAYLDRFHTGSYMVWNVSDRRYDYSRFHHQVLEFGWPDHMAPPLEKLFQICTSMDSWLKGDERNVAVVHCLAGLGRTGTAIAAYLVYAGEEDSHASALQRFARQRCRDQRGVRIPSQLRYVEYFDLCVKGHTPHETPILFSKIVISPIPSHKPFKPFIKLTHRQSGRVVFCNSNNADSLRTYDPDQDEVMVIEVNTPVSGDLSLECYKAGVVTKKVFRVQFHTAFIFSILRLEQRDMDWAHKKKSFRKGVTVDLIFSHDVPTEEAHITPCFNTLTQKLLAAKVAGSQPKTTSSASDENGDDDDFDDDDDDDGDDEILQLESELRGQALLSSASPSLHAEKAPMPDRPPPPLGPWRLDRIIMHAAPRFDETNTGCSPIVQVWSGQSVLASRKCNHITDANMPFSIDISLVDDTPLMVHVLHQSKTAGFVLMCSFPLALHTGTPQVETIGIGSPGMKVLAKDEPRFPDKFRISICKQPRAPSTLN